ncbi:MAG: hypothetical protein ACYTAN_13335 [Planctomycetota bacterium]|jgi:hypothetical protein
MAFVKRLESKSGRRLRALARGRPRKKKGKKYMRERHQIMTYEEMLADQNEYFNRLFPEFVAENDGE